MFNLQQCEISIYHQHNNRELERQKKGERGKREEWRIYVFATLSSSSWTEYQLEHGIGTRAESECVSVRGAPIRATDASSSLSHCGAERAHICSLSSPWQKGGAVSPSYSRYTCSLFLASSIRLGNIRRLASFRCLKHNSIHANISKLPILLDWWNNPT